MEQNREIRIMLSHMAYYRDAIRSARRN
jgi:hypothetical protein